MVGESFLTLGVLKINLVVLTKMKVISVPFTVQCKLKNIEINVSEITIGTNDILN